MDKNHNQATWIWYPDDYEIWLHQKVSVLRQFRGYICPPSWRLDSAYTSVKFRKTFDFAQPELLTLSVQGTYVLHMDGSMTPVPYERRPVTSLLIPAGKHELTVTVYNDQTIPAVYATGGANSCTDNTWEVSAYNGKWVRAASWNFHDICCPPSGFPFSYETVRPTSISTVNGAIIVDFGRETFGYIKFLGAAGKGTIRLYYGESLQEAMAGELAETFDELAIESDTPLDYTTSVTRAFRYIQLRADEGISWRELIHEYEYVPLEKHGSFSCSDERINQIWDVSAHTLHMNMREFIFDGMKRDRWVWSGDANLGFLINNYVFFEQDVTKRTLVALRGKEPVEIHMNTIMDYTFYWFISLSEYYLYTGDIAFIEANYAKMLSLMNFCLKRCNDDGMMEGYPDDWVFVDWAPMERRGELCFEQLLFCRSMETMAGFAKELGDKEDEERFVKLAEKLRQTIFSLFWDEEQGGLIHGRLDGELNQQMLKYPSMFAMRFGYLDLAQQEMVRQHVLLNEGIQKISTPFMRFFELEALCQIGEQERVLQEIRDYWGGMLDLGATTFWEEYDPSLPDELQYDMYGDKFRKSLCHAWGAAPIYLTGKYVLGVKPLKPGYKHYQVEPHLCGLDWIKGAVPTPDGEIVVYMDKSRINVTTSSSGTGVLSFTSEWPPEANEGELKRVSEFGYELILSRLNFQYEIIFRPLIQQSIRNSTTSEML
ncbi:alpha-L-rhamnosidase-related protein [Paenibacillus eucommiae]|uniref:Alpha-L-rhamnosidase n=1 Tax=Paenibacillus eucommiae TaxID=1355755 RepID=A0ABS4ILS2_9BACL|nr:alpha-L-rhamnosidase C-terminal domain-containing protein [Paenibacillus eucommiae]MBP1988474.1 hypothetical protein [Paenibacillus eucommiae]